MIKPRNISTCLLHIIVLVQIVNASDDQKFVYNARDILVIQPNSTADLSLQLTTSADEYLSQSALQATLSLVSLSTTVPYNILYFNYQSPSGQTCYQNWMLTGQIQTQQNCSTLVSEEVSDLPYCCQYLGCSNEKISLSITLQEEIYRQSLVVIENSNAEDQVELYSSLQLELSSDSSWFYLGVGLTCLLLISLVIFIGAVFYWLLKYKRVKKMYEQFKLTQQNVSKQD